MRIEQAIFVAGPAGADLQARSAGFADEWRPAADQLCAGFGRPPAGAPWPAAVFARPLGSRHVAVVTVREHGGSPRFRLLAVPQPLYRALGGDPFLIADAFPPAWDDRGELPALEWSAGPPPPRTVADLQRVLDVPYSATLLGGVQALLDGGRLAFERTAPAPELVRSLWALLPYNARAELWPASYAFSNALGFDVAVVPRADGPEFAGYLFEEQAGDYPEGRYELALQTAVEAGDQDTLDRLLARRSRSQVARLAYTVLAVLLLGPLFVAVCVPSPPPRPAPPAAPPPAEKRP